MCLTKKRQIASPLIDLCAMTVDLPSDDVRATESATVPRSLRGAGDLSDPTPSRLNGELLHCPCRIESKLTRSHRIAALHLCLPRYARWITPLLRSMCCRRTVQAILSPPQTLCGNELCAFRMTRALGLRTRCTLYAVARECPGDRERAAHRLQLPQFRCTCACAAPSTATELGNAPSLDGLKLLRTG
ncbi:hypothetical protein MSAN_01338400 [Mycena sanguinolenta]|uniref:Uncharacterized protein n=1 Tax=Mycena sanguinolenta TaxID=230812 RepID=A0A8H6YFP8_9AGAR|nr:hypothetical protein MSAN_01338400 [Mycena sanguinolenta]